HVEQVRAESDGVVTGLDAMAVGVAAWRLGAGRSRPGEAVQAAAGVEITRHIGEQVRAGDVLARLHTDTPERIARAAQAIDGAWAQGGWVCPAGAWVRDDRGPGRPSRPPPGLTSPATSASRSAPGTSWHGCTPTPPSASPARPRRSTGPGISPLWAPRCPSAGSCWTASPDHLVPRRALPRSGPWRSRGNARRRAAHRMPVGPAGPA